MGCNCKVSENIDRIHRIYGDKHSFNKKTDIKSIVLNKVRSCFVFIITLPFIPFMLIINIYKLLAHKTIKISKIVRPHYK